MILPTRADAGQRLAELLLAQPGMAPVVIAISPGGARVAYEVARALAAPLDFLPTRRLEVPGRTHSCFGAVAPGAALTDAVAVSELDLPPAYIETLVGYERAEMEHDSAWFHGGLPGVPLMGRSVILVDDGCAHQWMIRAAIRALRGRGAERVIYAAPAGPRQSADWLKRETDGQVVLDANPDRQGLHICDEYFVQTTGSEVRRMMAETRLRASRATLPASAPVGPSSRAPVRGPDDRSRRPAGSVA